MSRMREIDVRAETTARPDVVFALLEDAATWPSWTSIESVTLEREGTPAPNGVGAIRVNRRGRVTGRDEVIDIVPGRRWSYRSLSGVPVRDYVGTVDIEPTAGGSAIRWHVTFRPSVAGTGRIVQASIQRFLAECVDGLARRAAEITSASPGRNGP